MDESSELRQILKQERLNFLEVAETVQQILEIVTSEISLDHPIRQQIEAFFPVLRKAVDGVRERVGLPPH